MLQSLKKKKHAKVKFDEPLTDQIVCGACKHVRQPTACCPEWQCPGCGKAYNKTRSTPEAIKQQRRKARERQKQYEEESKQKETDKNIVATGLTAGATTFGLGLSRTVSSCAQPLVKTVVAANPVLQIIGVALVVASLAYAWHRFF